MNILVVLNYYHPYVSGLSEYARLEATQLAREHQVTVLTGRHDATLPETELNDGVRVVRANTLFSIHKGYISAALLRKFRELAREADIVYMHLPMLEASVLARMIPKRCKLIAMFHCWPVAVGGWLDRCAVAIVRRSIGDSLARADRIVVNTLDYSEQFDVLVRQRTKLREIPPPTKEFALPIRQSVAAATSTPKVGFVGRFVEEKGLDFLLEAVPQVWAVRPEVEFFLAGAISGVRGGTIFQRLEPLIRSLGDRVHVLGAISDEDLCEFYDSLDLFVLPSTNIHESFGMVQVEAMKRGVPVVASDLGGIRVPVQRTGNGVLTPARNSQALATAIIQCLNRTWDRGQVSQTAMQHFDNHSVFQAFDRVIEDTFTD